MVNGDNAIKNVISASAPERSGEILQMWEKYNPQPNLVGDRSGFTLEAGSFGLLVFNHKTMCKIWLLGFAAQHSFNLYQPHLFLAQIIKYPFSLEHLADDVDANQINGKITAIYNLINELVATDSIENINWPAGVPKPDDGKPSDVFGSVVFDLLCMASAYCFLHELRHIQYRESGETLSPVEEEFACDKYARDFLLEKIDVYAKSSGYDLALLKNKRGMAIALASILLLVITPESHWSGSSSHPSVVERILELAKNISIGDNDYLWFYLSSLLLSEIKIKEIQVNPVAITTQRDYCFVLLRAIQAHLDAG
ncbi:MAG: hypothetical protein HS120_09530 [Burkholderiales bacterium]|nr:hypothetical protein [Burkholderiales bacterium]